MTEELEHQLERVLQATAAKIRPVPPDPDAARALAARPAEGEGHSPRRWLAPVAAAAAVLAVVTVPILVVHSNQTHTAAGSGGSSSPATTRPASTSPSLSTSNPASSAAGRPANCTAAQLRPSVLQSGTAQGTEVVVIGLRNTSAASCWLSGIPTLEGVTATGSTVRLPFTRSADPAYVQQDPVAGPGAVPAGALGAFRASMQLNGCAKAAASYTRLAIQLGDGARIDMPYPADLSVTGCFGGLGQAGPAAQ
jgi:Protein of unknown function (DUF4232)